MNEITIKPKTAASELVRKSDSILRSILPANAEGSRFIVSAIAAANKLKANCDAVSTAMAVFNAASLGLPIDTAEGYCYLVPFKGKVSLIVGYRGFLHLAFESGFLKQISTDVVLSGESWEQFNDERGKHFRHEIPLERSMEFANVHASYCAWTNTRGGDGFVVVNRPELVALERASFGSSPWKSKPIEMSLKTAIRRASKLWNLTNTLAAAVQLDEEWERGDKQTNITRHEFNEQRATSTGLDLGQFKEGRTDETELEDTPTSSDERNPSGTGIVGEG